MWSKFKWDMFITSFLPLWFSIVVSDLWDCILTLKTQWNVELKFWNNLLNCIHLSMLQVCTIGVVLVIVSFSIGGINCFLRDKGQSENKTEATVLRVRKANKLSAEFLLAYILPMIAFDFGEPKSVLLFVIYFFVLAILCIRNSNIYTNIFLEFKGYKMYSCDIERNVIDKKRYHDCLVISKTDMTLQEGNTLPFWDFENYIYIHFDGEGNV